MACPHTLDDKARSDRSTPGHFGNLKCMYSISHALVGLFGMAWSSSHSSSVTDSTLAGDLKHVSQSRGIGDLWTPE